MKVKIVEPGFAGYTGPLIGIQFENGVSTRDVSEMEVSAIGSIMRVESVDGGQVGVAVDLIKNYGNEAPIVRLEAAKSEPKPEPKVEIYSRADLEAIADKEGINGIRKISDKLGIKGKSINVLIDGVLDKQGNNAPVVE